MACTDVKPFLITASKIINCKDGKYEKTEARAAAKEMKIAMLKEAEKRCAAQGTQCFLMGGGEVDASSMLVTPVDGKPGKCKWEFGMWFACGSGPRGSWHSCRRRRDCLRKFHHRSRRIEINS